MADAKMNDMKIFWMDIADSVLFVFFLGATGVGRGIFFRIKDVFWTV